MTKNKGNIIRIIAAVLLGAACITFSVLGFGAKKVFAGWTNDGGVDHYTDMSSDGADLEYYDVLYNYNWFLYKSDVNVAAGAQYDANTILGKLPERWEMKDDALLRFNPSAKNTTASFVWKFDYTPTEIAANGTNIYPLSVHGWKGAGQIDIAAYFTEVGKKYAVELGVVKVKNNTQYFVYLKVDGEYKIGTYRTRATVGDYATEADYTGLYVYLASGARGTISVPEGYADTLEKYITVQNADIGAPESFSDTSYEHYYSSPTPYDTASMSYKFGFTSAGATYVTVRDRQQAWGGYKTILNGRHLQYNLNAAGEAQTTYYNMLPESGKYVVEIGAVDIKNSDLCIYFVKIDGEYKLYEIMNKVVGDDKCGVGAWGAASTFSQVDDTTAIEYEFFDTLRNYDWKIDGKTVVGDEFSLPATNEAFIDFTPSESNVTASFVWNFVYTPAVAYSGGNGDYMIYHSATGAWAGNAVNIMTLGRLCTEKDRAYSVELGSKKIKNSEKYFNYLSVDGKVGWYSVETRASENAKGLFLYCANGGGKISLRDYRCVITDDTDKTVYDDIIGLKETLELDLSAYTDDKKVLIGVEYNGKLYKTVNDVIANKTDGELHAKLVTVALSYTGAEMKYLYGDTDATLKFGAKVVLNDYVTDFGMLFTVAGELEGKDSFTHESLLDAAYKYDLSKNGGMSFVISGGENVYSLFLNGISVANYDTEFVARAYVKVTYADGSEGYVYTPYDAANNAATLKAAAQKELEKADLSDARRTLCQSIIGD